MARSEMALQRERLRFPVSVD